jgi:hypothetical protein
MTKSTGRSAQACATCYGEGTTGDLGPCPDCAGMGVLPSGLVLTEWRLRELERNYGKQGGEAGQDVAWLISEVRRAHHALLQILAASQDMEHDAQDDAGRYEAARKAQFLANEVLGMYPVVAQRDGTR